MSDPPQKKRRWRRRVLTYEQTLSLASAYATLMRLSLRTINRRAYPKDVTALNRLAMAKSISSNKTIGYFDIEQPPSEITRGELYVWLSNNWPKGVDWPVGIPGQPASELGVVTSYSNLKAWRVAARLKQAQVETILGLPKSRISHLECGKAVITDHVLQHLAPLYGGTPAALLGPPPKKDSVTIKQENKMSDNMDVSNLILEHLRAIRASQDAMREDVRDIKGRLVVLEAAFGTLSAAYGGLSSRIDRIELRLERIEKRLELVEA